MSAWIGPQPAANSLPVTVSTDQVPIPVTLENSNPIVVEATGSVEVTNFPVVQEVSGSVAVINFPEQQLIYGSVFVMGSIAVTNFPGSVAVTNFPGTQAVVGSVSVTNFPSVQTVNGSVAVAGSVAVVNFPGTQPVTVSGSVAVSTVAGSVSVLQASAPWLILGTVSAIQSGTWTVQQGSPPWQQNISQYGGSSTSLGQKMMAQSLPVTIASDQAPLDTIKYYNDNLKIYSTATSLSMASAGADNPLVLIRNPAGSGKTLYVITIFDGCTVTNVEADYAIYANPTVTTNGSALAVVSRNVGGGAPASVMLATTLPTVSALGSLLSVLIQGQNGNSVIFDDNFSIAVKPGNAILITGNPSSNNRNCRLTVMWIEL